MENVSATAEYRYTGVIGMMENLSISTQSRSLLADEIRDRAIYIRNKTMKSQDNIKILLENKRGQLQSAIDDSKRGEDIQKISDGVVTSVNDLIVNVDEIIDFINDDIMKNYANFVNMADRSNGFQTEVKRFKKI